MIAATRYVISLVGTSVIDVLELVGDPTSDTDAEEARHAGGECDLMRGVQGRQVTG